ncbi:MAG: carboxypeptidase regulatory-like domain-containing protein, partial [Candidatus Tyrphobacter sp.]
LDAAGVPVAGAAVRASGPMTRNTSTDAHGGFTISGLAPGIYRVDVTKGGYASASVTNVALTPGETLPLNVTLYVATLSSLRTIAHTSASASSSINTGAAAQSFIGRQEFSALANPQINDVIQRIPTAVVERGSSSPNTSISLGGMQPYETQVLLDGHPLSAGRYGVWFSQFFSSWLVGNVETETGPGNTTPFAGTAVGGTINIETPAFTQRPTYEITYGDDSYASQTYNVLTSGSLGRLQYVLGAGYDSSNGPYFGKFGCVVTPNNTNLDNKPGSSGIIEFCNSLNGSLFTKGEIVKLKYNFSPVTSLSLGYVGSQAGYLPQGSSYGQYLQNFLVTPCLSNGHDCTNPFDPQYVGHTIGAYVFYPGSNVYNNQPLFTGELRTAIGNDTLLVRPYAGNIARIIDGSHEDDYPAFYYPNTSPSSVCTGAPTYGIVGPMVGTETECLESDFSVLESDKLFGTTASYVHPFGDDFVELTYDYHSDETFAYYNTPSDIVVPDTTAKFNSLSLIGEFLLDPTLTLKAGVYETDWGLNGVQAVAHPGGKTSTAPLTRTVSRIDPHIALIYQPHGNVSYRLSWGTSATFPYSSLVSGVPFITKGSATAPLGTFTLKDPFLNPEVADEFDLGMDRAIGRGVLSIDLLDAQVHNVFETIATPVTNPLYSFIDQPVNVADLSVQQATLRYSYQPPVGLGYYIAGAINRSIVQGVPKVFYTSPTAYVLPANGVQQCSNGGTEVCIPYLKAYAALSYTTRARTYFLFDADFEGKNNTYNLPPFVFFNIAIRQPVTPQISVQLSGQNVFNIDTYENLPEPNAGIPEIGESSTGLGSILSPLIPAPTQTFRLDFIYQSPGRQP